MREQRSNHNENAKRAADSRDSVQNQGKELRERIGDRLEEQKEVRARAKVHQAKPVSYTHLTLPTILLV